MNTRFSPQLDLLGSLAIAPSVLKAIETMASASAKERGAVFTRPETVCFILDLIGYTPDKALEDKRLLEPSFGHGEFLKAAIDRLLTSWKRRHIHSGSAAPANLLNAIRAVELHRESYLATRRDLDTMLSRAGFSRRARDELLSAWLIQGDFLLTELPTSFNYVVGNPPYVRQESIPDVLLAAYKSRFHTLFDRADLYVLFYERSLDLLATRGKLAFICSDRWIKNKYGSPLRKLIASEYHLKIFVDMFGTAAFSADVIAYPAITVIERTPPAPTRVAHRPVVDKKTLSGLVRPLRDGVPSALVQEISALPPDAPWILESSPELDLVRKLERDHPFIEQAGCKVGIGVATGADKVFIAPFHELPVEPSRKIPLIQTGDILSGEVNWQGYGVLNPFEDDGSLVDLKAYPKLAAYLDLHARMLRQRHVAQKNNKSWFRTIDRITPALAERQKLLIPDIKGDANIVLDRGNYYPHHNLYYITSESWDIEALQTFLRSGIARLFVSAYSTRMRGGYLRYQAQYLRRIHIPTWNSVSPSDRRRLRAPHADGSRFDAVARILKLKESETNVLRGQCESGKQHLCH